MRALKKLLGLLLSLKTSVVLLLLLLGVLFYGSFIMPAREEFGSLHAVPLFRWLTENPPGITWWLWGSIGILAALAANTIFCSVESLVKKRGARQWLLVISPQVIHAGFLLMLLAHLMSSYGGFRGTAVVYEGSTLRLPGGSEVLVTAIDAVADRAGYVSDWSAGIAYMKDGAQIKKDVILPNKPSFRDGFGVYVKMVRMDPRPAALIEVSKEPGALWALAGAVLFMVGTVTLLIIKVRREEAMEG